MIKACDFVDAARERGFDWYAGVPCSYLTPFINYVSEKSKNSSLHYVSMANEGDAVAFIAGVALAGAPDAPTRAPEGIVPPRRGITMMQNSGLGNAVSPLTSLTWTFRLPQLLIITWRGQENVADEPQHELMGEITRSMLDIMKIPWEFFPTEREEIAPALDRAIAHMDAKGLPYALVMKKGSVEPYSLQPGIVTAHKRTTAVSRLLKLKPEDRPLQLDVLRMVVAQTPTTSTVVLASTGFCGRVLDSIGHRPNQLYMVGSMGCIAPLALGLALARPDLRVVALDGDGAALMRMGAFATVGACRPPNLQHLLLDNGVHNSTGGQATTSPYISFAGVAAACGYASSLETDDSEEINKWLGRPNLDGPHFACLLTNTSMPDNIPRPSKTPVEVKKCLMKHIAPTAGVR